MYSNIKEFGGNFQSVVEEEIHDSVGVQIATGYASYDVLNVFKQDLERLSDGGGQVRLLLGMAFYEGLTHNKLLLLNEMSNLLQGNRSDNGVYVSYSRRYHGKIYVFDKGDEINLYVGSSNFSKSGLRGNIECTVAVTDEENKVNVSNFLSHLFDSQNAVSIQKADIPIPGTKNYRNSLSLATLDDLERYDPGTIDESQLDYFTFNLDRVVDKDKSNLNVYFGKGRWARATGKIKPRPWYEAELIADREINSNPLYPQGDFLAYTDDGYIIPMKTQGDNNKNIRSRHSLQIFGMWIKGKLQKSGSLIPLTPVTQDTLDAYGNDSLYFYKIAEGKYYFKF